MTRDKTHKDENMNVLALEDSVRDFELIKELLIDAGYTLTIERVETEDAFAASLRYKAWDLILADFKLPAFDAFGALRLRNEICPDTPFICVSGSIGEETAIELLKSGAVDYVIKDRPDRLPFAVGRALKETREKKICQQNDEALKEEREKFQARLNQAQKMEAIGVLAGGIAHDFNNILFPIIGYSDMLLNDIPKDSPVRKSLEQIHTSAIRAKELVHQILAFSRQEKNELARMKMQPIVKEALKLIRSTIPTTISINQHLHPACGPVKADPVQIHQIIMNLATNAYHAMAETGGTLTVTLTEIQADNSDPISPDLQPGSYACLSVADTGTGMDKETAEKIFDPFFTTKKKGKGTGMGLSVVHGIVKAMNGTIQVQTEPGRGTAFHLFLPVAGTGAAENTPLIKEPLVGGSERILLVDDEKPVIAIEEQLLSRLGYQVTGCTGSTEALEMFTADPDRFDMVITDTAMPKMSGDKLACELLKIRPDIPILLCTGFSETMTDEKIASLGVKGLLMKPVVIYDLDRKLREIFGQTK